MKKNQLYHPVVKALCLILCITCILTFTFCTLRAFYLDDLGIMYDDPQFSVPSDSQSLQYSDFTLYWPYDYAWDTVDLLNPWAWSASDPLRAYLCELLYTGDYYSYLGLSSEGRVPNEKPPIYPDTDYTPDTDMVTDSETTSPAPNYSEERSDAVTNGLAEKPNREMHGTTDIDAGDADSRTAASPSETVQPPSADTAAPLMPAPTERDGQIFPANCTTALTDFLSTYDASRTNLRFRVWLDDTVILSNDAAWDNTLSFSFYAEAPIVNDLKNTGHTIRIECGLLSGCPIPDDYSSVYQAWQQDAAHWEIWILAAVATAVLSIAFLVCVLYQTGMRYSTQALHLTAIDRLPLEPVVAVLGAVLSVALLLIPELDFYLDQSLLLLFGYLHGNLREWFPALALAALSIAAVLLSLSILCGCVRRIRAGKWWKNTLCYRILHILLCAVTYLLRAAGRMISKAGTNVSLFWRWIAGCSAFGLWTFIVMLSRTPILWGIWIVTAAVLGLALCLYMLEWDIIRKNTEKIAMGDLTHHTETARLHGAPKVVGKDLNRIGDAISLAVEDRMKSERFRSELITNVSHDLKTPLTSIINYTDLLSKEDCENETMRGYIDVLSRQAYRLKKLTEDLLEVSKASAQTLPVVLDTTDAAELLQQAIGEYESRLAAAGLQLVLSISENPLFILADGKHLWRVFDNLLSNICKYSLPGTRVYLSSQMASDTVLLTFRNISAAPIAVSANELTERFVRGDASRHTEGSGLGLAIAESLCRLQNGSLEISVDGDLFKVVVAFHAIDTPTSSKAVISPHM